MGFLLAGCSSYYEYNAKIVFDPNEVKSIQIVEEPSGVVHVMDVSKGHCSITLDTTKKTRKMLINIETKSGEKFSHVEKMICHNMEIQVDFKNGNFDVTVINAGNL